MKLPNFNRLNQLKSEITSFIVSHIILVLASIVISISVMSFGVWAIKVRSNFIASMKSAQKDSSNKVYYSATPNLSNLNLDNLSSSDSSVLGISDQTSFPNVKNNSTFSIPTPYPIITQAPLPTIIPESTTNTYSYSSTPSCAGTPTAYNSEAIVSSSSTLVNNAITITVELLDCNNNYAPVNDSLTISLSNSDSSARINGSSSPVTIQAQNGKATFSVNSQNATTDTFVISDTSKSFTITDPHNHNPSVTFTNNSSGNSNCTTGTGVPNLWYSDVYPNPPISTNNGSITIIVDLRDCNQKLTLASDTLNISVSSGNSDTQMNGGSLPQNVTTQNGEAKFTISSQMNGTVTLTIQDTTSGFTVTDPNNHNPTITFTSSSVSTLTPTPTPATIDTPTPAPAETVTPTPAPTEVPTPTPTSSITIPSS